MASIEKISKGQLDYSTTMQRLWRHVATLQSSCRSKEDRTNCCIRARRPVHPRSIHFREIWPNISEWGQEVAWWVHKRAFYTFGGAIKQRGWRRWRQATWRGGLQVQATSSVEQTSRESDTSSKCNNTADHEEKEQWVQDAGFCWVLFGNQKFWIQTPIENLNISSWLQYLPT